MPATGKAFKCLTFAKVQHTVLPYDQAQGPKKLQVQTLFDRIAGRYDRLNEMLSFRLHRHWRRQLVAALEPRSPQDILDLATGTGDVAFELLRLNPQQVIGIDLSAAMLAVANRKAQKHPKAQLVRFLQADSERLPFEDNMFDAVTVAFGIRNFEHLHQAFAESLRVLRPQGCFAILEFSLPPRQPMKSLFHAYLRLICPLLGGCVSGHWQAYWYLYQSIAAFPQPEVLRNQLEKVGFRQVTWQRLFPGICTLLLAYK